MTPLYRCDICHGVYADEASAAVCEAKGTPQPPAYLAARVGEDVPTFVADGVALEQLHGFDVVNDGGHVLVARVGISDEVPLSTLDPMASPYFLNDAVYQPALVVGDAIAWAEWCVRYGIAPTPTGAAWWEALPVSVQARITEGIRSYRKSWGKAGEQ